MQPTYEELLFQNQHLTLLLKEALAEIQTLKAKIKELEDKLNTNSSNSSKPPSQDPHRKTKRKQKTGRKQGAQPGHSGHRRSLYPSDQVQTTHDLKPGICPDCLSTTFHSETISTEVRQVLELPDAPPEVTQYNIHTCACTCCGKYVKADIPREARYGFGPRLMGFVTSLSGEFRLSKRQVVALVGKIGIRLCSGSVCKIHERAGEILKTPYEEIKKHTLLKGELNLDETSWKTLSEKRWNWIGRGPDSMFFAITKSRSTQAFKDVFGQYKGCITTDRYGAYNSHEGPQQLCWSHGDRDFEKIAGREGIDKWIGERLLECKTAVFDLWHRYKDGQINRCELIKQVEGGLKEDMKVILKAGAAHEECCNKTKATCADFFKRFDALWIFVYRENVEPTNNAAEQGLRHGVIWRKLCYGSQSEVGERFVERVMTIAMTLRLRAKNSFDYFTECFREYIRGGPSPPVLT